VEKNKINGYDKNLNNQYLAIFNFIDLDFDMWKKNKINGYDKKRLDKH